MCKLQSKLEVKKSNSQAQKQKNKYRTLMSKNESCFSEKNIKF